VPAYDDLTGVLECNYLRPRTQPGNSCDGPCFIERIKTVETDIKPARNLPQALLAFPACYLDETNRWRKSLEEGIKIMLINRYLLQAVHCKNIRFLFREYPEEPETGNFTLSEDISVLHPYQGIHRTT